SAVADLVEGRLGPSARHAADAHLEGCSACRSLVDALSPLKGDASPWIEGLGLGDDAADAFGSARPGQIVAGRWVLERELGRGGMGVVWRASDRVTDQRVAVKLLKALSPDRLRRFQREARIGARLDHPNIVRMLDVADDADAPVLIMELLEGESLAARL